MTRVCAACAVGVALGWGIALGGTALVLFYGPDLNAYV